MTTENDRSSLYHKIEQVISENITKRRRCVVSAKPNIIGINRYPIGKNTDIYILTTINLEVYNLYRILL